MSRDHDEASLPRVGLLYCGGAMSSAGELTGIAAFEVLKRLGPNEVGMGCVSALASMVPKHFNTIQNLEKVIVIDGCPNSCVKKIVESTGSKMDGYINLGIDLKVKKRGPFKPFDYTEEELERVVEAVIAKVKGER